MKKEGALLVALAAMLTHGGAAHAEYFVRPYVGFSTGGVQDGLVENGATSKTVGFSDAARSASSTVDLSTGSLKGYAAQYVNSVMGDTITFRGGASTTWDFGFTLDGSLSATLGLQAPGNNSSTGIAYSLTFAVYRPGEVNSGNWFSQSSKALFFQNQDIRYTFPGDDDPTGAIYDSISGNLALDTDYEAFEIYARIFASASALAPTGLVSSEVDLSHTGTVDFAFAPGVSAYSDSGVFLGLGLDPVVPGVPEPGSMALMLAGLVATVGLFRRRRA